MIKPSDITWLAISCAVAGALIGGLVLAWGLGLAATGHPLGFLLIAVAVPLAGAIGWRQGKKLAKKL